jgi:hypothetical protein
LNWGFSRDKRLPSRITISGLSWINRVGEILVTRWIVGVSED